MANKSTVHNTDCLKWKTNQREQSLFFVCPVGGIHCGVELILVTKISKFRITCTCQAHIFDYDQKFAETEKTNFFCRIHMLNDSMKLFYSYL